MKLDKISRSRKTPGGKTIKIAKEKKAGHAICAVCGVKLMGVPKGKVNSISKLSKTQRRPQRPYAGVLCSNCSRNLFKSKIRVDGKTQSVDQTDLRLLKFLKSMKKK